MKLIKALFVVACFSATSALAQVAIDEEIAKEIKNFGGVQVPSTSLSSQEGQSFGVLANKAYVGRPGEFYHLFMLDVRTVLYNTDASDEITVVYTSDCRNYDREEFTAYVSCEAHYDPVYDRSVAPLSADNCVSDEPAYRSNKNFLAVGWYLAGRSGYYESQNCQAKVAVVKNGHWLVDPIGWTTNFTVNFERSYTEKSDFLRQDR